LVVCLDGSELAERALPFAADLAQRLAAELVLVRVVPEGRLAPGDIPEVTYLRDLAELLPGPPPLLDVVQDRQPARAITRYVGDRGDSIVVVATHGRGGLRSAVMGGVAHGITHQAACPVLVVPARAARRVIPGGAAPSPHCPRNVAAITALRTTPDHPGSKVPIRTTDRPYRGTASPVTMRVIHEEATMRTLRVSDVMTSRVVAVTAATPFRDVVDLMLRHEISSVPVLDDDGGLVGLISEADVLSKQAYGGRRRSVLDGISGLARREMRELTRSRGRTAREIMSAPVETVLVDEPLRAVACRMLENRLKHLVVVDNARRIIGIVSRRDLLRAFDRTDTEIAAGVVDALATSEYSGRVAVTVDGGVVTLEGKVPRREDVASACWHAWTVPGVVDVVDHLILGTPIERGDAGGATAGSTAGPAQDH
jgi:CBS domain-containing protein/nucleotide-binding universal stress UspA family protein